MEETDPGQLLAIRAKGEREAFGELYDIYYPRIYAFVLKRAQNIQDSEDITARTFEKALRRIKQFDPSRGTFTNWIYKIAINETRDFFRKNRRRPRVSLYELGEVFLYNPVDDIDSVREFTDLMRLIQKLSESHQAVLLLRFIEGLGYEDISQIVGCSTKAISMRLTRALRALEKVAVKEGIPLGEDRTG